MSWIAVTLDIFGRLYEGGTAEGWLGDTKSNTEEAEGAAFNIFEEQKKLAGRASDVATDKALTTREFSMNKLGFGARSSLTDLDTEGNKMIAGANMAGGSMYTRAVEKKKESIYDTYRSSQEYVKDSYSHAIETADIINQINRIMYFSQDMIVLSCSLRIEFKLLF